MINRTIVINARFLTQKVTGVQRFAIEICKMLRNLSNNIVFVSPGDILDNRLAEELKAIVIGKNKGTIWEQIDLRRYLKANNNPLLINFCNTGMLFYKNQIVTIHDMSYKVNPGWFSKKFYWWYNFLIPHIAHNSIKVLTVSNSSKSDIIKYLGIESDKINVVYNSILTIDNQNFKENELGKYILTISSLDPRKNLNNLIKSFKGIDQEIKLVIVGLKSSNFAKALDEDLIDNNVIIKGYVTDDDLASLMYHAQAFVYVSLYEGFGLPPLEAMAFGCPVIASDIQSLKEICAEAAEYVNPYDVNNIRDKILKVLNDPLLREKLILKGHKNIERFSWSASANKVFNIINEVL